MSVVTANQIPYMEEVWNVIEAELKTVYKAVYRVDFNYSAFTGTAILVISHRIAEEPNSDVIALDKSETTKMVMRLCEKFNIPKYSLNGLEFCLKPDEVPNFTVKLYPYKSSNERK